ncbi:hypothetical protein [Oligoflexus tunisiensis]|uniref:hypothetical protein n=1 Tax=Oligoflexus tunisiensis TaxID=708132 RepID=UPI00114C8AD3|nr:hypothetical protein [Oligoflexus tunisiensis]
MRRWMSCILFMALQGLGVIPVVFAMTPMEREYQAALEFRKLFAGHAAASYGPDEIRQLIFLPNRAVLERRLDGLASVEDVLAAHRSRLQTILPGQLYREAAHIPHPEDVLTPRHPVTIVILPGIFGEFIDHIPYEEILADPATSFAQTWAQVTADPDFADPVLDLDSMEQHREPIRDLVKAGSLDDASGNARVRILLLKAPKASLESLGTLAETTAIYQRRLTKIFNRLGPPEHAYFLGYSRGLNVGMELVSTTDPGAFPWIRGFQGLISLGGVTYGSAVADRALNPERVEGRILQRIHQLADTLEIPEAGAVDTIGMMLRNTGRWAAALADIAAMSREMAPPTGLQLENIQSDAIDIGFLARMFRDIALEKFQLDRPFTDYVQNVRRFKLFVKEAQEGVLSLGTEACLAWMKTHRLPEQLHYYAITSTMPDPSTPETGVAPLTANPLAYEPRGMDYRMLRASYYSYWEESGMSLNDSQISLDRSPFWPELHQLANPEQKPFRSTLLAVLGTDHWGMAFPVAFETESGRINPFPRTILMRALGDYLGAQEEARTENRRMP